MTTKNETERQLGPFEDTTTRTYELTPIKLTVTDSRKSSHVPPPTCGCGGGGIDVSDILGAIGSQLGGLVPTGAPSPVQYVTPSEIDQAIKDSTEPKPE